MLKESALLHSIDIEGILLAVGGIQTDGGNLIRRSGLVQGDEAIAGLLQSGHSGLNKVIRVIGITSVGDVDLTVDPVDLDSWTDDLVSLIPHRLYIALQPDNAQDIYLGKLQKPTIRESSRQRAQSQN